MARKEKKKLLTSEEDKRAAVIAELKRRKPGGPIIQWEDHLKKKRRREGYSFLGDLIYSKRLQHRIIKAALGFPIGLTFGAALYFGVIQFMDLNEFVLHFLGLIFGLSIAIGYSLSVQVRCICWLILPTLFGKSGRTYLGTIAVAEVINGPYENLVYNTKDSVRVIGCITSLSLNHSIDKFKLMLQPLKEVAEEFLKGKKDVQEEAISMMDVFEPIENEVRSEEEMNDIKAESDDLDQTMKIKSRIKEIDERFEKQKSEAFGKKTENNYRKKQEYRCEEIFTKAIKKCRDAHADSYRICLSKLPIVGYLICWVMKLDFVCNMAKSKDTCNSRDSVNDGFGESIDTISLVREQVNEQFHVKLYYKLRVPEINVNQIVAKDLTESLTNQFEIRRRIANVILTLIKRMLALFFIYMFLSAKNYNQSYLRQIEYDNMYITSYFCRIDKRRKRMIMETTILLAQAIMVTFIITIDRIFYDFLMILQRSAHVEFHQQGVHVVELKIEGKGVIARIMRSIIRSFKIKHSLDKITSTLVCLPNPVGLESAKLLRIYGIYSIMWISIVIEAYGLRLRRVICGIFYPKREKKRTLFLYNTLLKKRKKFIRDMQLKLRELVHDGEVLADKSFLQILRCDYPKWFGWLKYLRLGMRNCIVCHEKEKETFQLCRNKCGAGYCKQCWRELDRQCYACTPDQDIVSETDLDAQ